MTVCDACECWSAFLKFAEERLSSAAFENWLAPIEVLEWSGEELVLGVPNIFVQQYLLDNYKRDLCAFLPVGVSGEPAIRFVIQERKQGCTEEKPDDGVDGQIPSYPEEYRPDEERIQFNSRYHFDTYIEGPSNQFVKSAAMGVARNPGRSYNLLFMHGGVGLGKTHLLHSIGHYVRDNYKRLRVQCITTEAFINDLVDSLRNKSIDKMKRYYRSLDVLLVDDIQFLQNRLNFEEEFCNTFEALINRGGLIVITSDKPPGQLRLSERIVARMEWGLVSSVNIPDLETRVAILLHKAEQKGLSIPHRVAFYIAEHIYSNVRQLEGAINRLSAHCRLLNMDITETLVEKALAEMLQRNPSGKISVDRILKSVAQSFQVKVSELTGGRRTSKVAVPRQVAMYLAREMVNESLNMIGCSFGGKRHSTILHACDKVKERMQADERFMRQVEMVRRDLEVS